MDYRAYVFGKNGQTIRRHEFQAADDNAALKHARQYIRDKDVEVWQENRNIGLLTSPGSAA